MILEARRRERLGSAIPNFNCIVIQGQVSSGVVERCRVSCLEWIKEEWRSKSALLKPLFRLWRRN
jgi:hypothetical protein